MQNIEGHVRRCEQ